MSDIIRRQQGDKSVHWDRDNRDADGATNFDTTQSRNREQALGHEGGIRDYSLQHSRPFSSRTSGNGPRSPFSLTAPEEGNLLLSRQANREESAPAWKPRPILSLRSRQVPMPEIVRELMLMPSSNGKSATGSRTATDNEPNISKLEQAGQLKPDSRLFGWKKYLFDVESEEWPLFHSFCQVFAEESRKNTDRVVREVQNKYRKLRSNLSVEDEAKLKQLNEDEEYERKERLNRSSRSDLLSCRSAATLSGGLWISSKNGYKHGFKDEELSEYASIPEDAEPSLEQVKEIENRHRSSVASSNPVTT